VVSPPVKWPCFYGIDTDTQQQLIGANLSVDEIAEYIGADSLAYLSQEGLLTCCRGISAGIGAGASADVEDASAGFCTACFSGEYPVRIPEATQATAFCGSLEPRFWEEERAGMRPLF
jgi:amidophosphoribosyltransferase